MSSASTTSHAEPLPNVAQPRASAPAVRRRANLRLITTSVAIFLILNVVFVADLMLPLGTTAGVVYVLAVLLSPLLQLRYAPIGVASVCSLLTIAGIVLSEPGDQIWWVIVVNRILVLAAIWFSALFVSAWATVTGTRTQVSSLEQRHDHLIENALDAIVTIDSQGTVLEWNPRAEEVFGWSVDEALGRPLAELIVPARDREAHRRGLERVTEGGDSSILKQRVEMTALRCDGDEFPVELAIIPIETMGQRVYSAFVRDITDRRTNEMELQRFADELETRNEEMEEIVSIIAHDLKRPIVSMNGLLSMIKEDAGSLLDDESIENLDLSIGECDRMQRMVTELGALARSERAPWEFDNVNLPELLQSCARRAQQHAERIGATVEIDCDDVEVPVSERHVKECLTNLIENALHYGCPESGMAVEVRGGIHGQMVKIHVIDHGPGIAPDQQIRVFELFRRGEASGQAPGSGIGLFAVRRLIQQIGGTISLESKVGEGATFTLSIPLHV